MGTRYKIYSVIIYAYIYVVNFTYGCGIEGALGGIVVREIKDHFRGEVFSGSTTNINSIEFDFNTGLEDGPYLDVSFENSILTIATNEKYELYEEYETSEIISLNVRFSCNQQTQTTVSFLFTVIDTNNHDPRFLPDEEYEFVVIPPLPPNYEITKNIRVRDIDLTTQEIQFEVIDSPNFEITYDGRTAPKEFGSILRTTTAIRNIPEPYVFKIRATDVDRTNDPPRSTIATVRIVSSDEFEFPSELAFTQTFYIASYTENDQIVLQEPISLQQGYHEDVKFSLDTTAEYREYFRISSDDNNVVLDVIKPIPEDFLVRRKLFLAVRADRELTTGTSATIIIQLPEVVNLKFEKSIYEGAIIDNILEPLDLLLSHSYENQPFSVEIISDYRTFFTPVIKGNAITLSMTPLTSAIIEENNVINLQVIASTTLSSATTVVTLEIIKDDTTTPVFNSAAYTGSYDPENGLNTQEILIVQGYSGVSLHLEGEHENLFSVVREDQKVVLSASTIPVNLFSRGHIILTVIATKPRTVGANAVISISLPSARNLEFSKDTFKGTIQDGELKLETITLSTGYADDVDFDIVGDASTYFKVSNIDNVIDISLPDGLPESVTSENSFLLLTLVASADHAVSASANILLEIIPEDIPVPRFSQHIYTGVYSDSKLDITDIILSEGYDDTVTFHLESDYPQYFAMKNDTNIVSINIESAIPEELIFSEKVLLLNIVAKKPLTVEARAVISVKFSPDLTEPAILSFEKNVYNGILKQNTLELESIVLDTGFNADTEFEITGQYIEYFTVNRDSNVINILHPETSLPSNIQEHKYIVFEIEATRARAITAYTTVIIEIRQPEIVPLVFTDFFYIGAYTLENGLRFEKDIYLAQGFDETAIFELSGESAKWFTVTQNTNPAFITIKDLPEDELDENHQLIFTLIAKKPESEAYATVIVNLPKEGDTPPVSQLAFTEAYYIFAYTSPSTLTSETSIMLMQGQMAEDVEFELEGENSEWFRVEPVNNEVKLHVSNTIPPAVLVNNQQLVFAITASRPGSTTARSTIVVTLPTDITGDPQLGFEHISYVGSIEGSSIDLPPIVLREGYTSNVKFSLHGDLETYFTLTDNKDSTASVTLSREIPDEEIPSNRIIVLHVEASADQTMSAFATIILEVVSEGDMPPVSQLAFTEAYYIFAYTSPSTLTSDTSITLAQGQMAEDVEFELEGENSDWFRVEPVNNEVQLRVSSAIPPAVLVNNQQLVFAITASKPGSTTARSTIVVTLPNDITGDPQLGFEHISYVGSIEGSSIDLPPIILREGYTSNVKFSLHGDLKTYFTITDNKDSTATVTLNSKIPDEEIPSNRIIVLHIEASADQTMSAFATIILEVVSEGDTPPVSQLAFTEAYYIFAYTSPSTLTSDTSITLAQGQMAEDVEFELEGENSEWFRVEPVNNEVQLHVSSTIPPAVLVNNQQLVFVITASRPGSTTARSTIVVTLPNDIDSNIAVVFNKVLYEGKIQGGNLQHEPITLTGYDGTDVEIVGAYSTAFKATHSDGVVTVEPVGTLPLPPNIQHIILELRVDTAGAVLLLENTDTDIPGTPTPTVTFRSPSYVIRIGIDQSGPVGRVEATADNDESVIYSLDVDNQHLLARLSITNDGELLVSAPINSGIYEFQVIATTIFSQASGTATVHLTVEAITTCQDNDIVTTPMIVIDRNEEQPNRNLVVLDPTQHAGCKYIISNSWPAEQEWLYVDETGLHSHSIDREHPSIAFMALSQIQAELTLQCENETKRRKRSVEPRLSSLGPYDYGDNSWIIGKTIDFDPRKTIVNLIVNDINDNPPIFVGKENEPIAVGYPVPNIQSTILPRSLIELQATDADVGDNAAIVYSTFETQLAVSSTTGFVHVKNNVNLEDNMQFTIRATDLNGQGLTGTISILVKMLEPSNIVVLTVRNSFLEDENSILNSISTEVGYEVKALRSAVILNTDSENEATRSSRNDAGASIEIYIYGLIDREPVSVDKLISDVSKSSSTLPVAVANIFSLERHLEAQQNCPNEAGLLAATIVLSVLLFAVIVAAIVWFVLQWRRKKNYQRFSSTSQDSIAQSDAGTEIKAEVTPMPRINVDELKRSEKRLQEMLKVPDEKISVEPSTSAVNAETVITLPDAILAPIVIQDKLKDADESDDDEFGERKQTRRKSVVTFNENVEKIITIENTPDEDEKDDNDSIGYYRL